jgi:hypothetical protein
VPHQDSDNIHKNAIKNLKFAVVVLSQINGNDQQLQKKNKLLLHFG